MDASGEAPSGNPFGGAVASASGLAGAVSQGTAGGFASFMKDVKSGVSTHPFSTLFNSDSSAGAMVGAGLEIAGAGFGAFRGISQMSKGGAKSVTSGLGVTLSSIAPLTGPAAPFVEAAGMIASLVGAFLPDPRQVRDKAITRELADASYKAPNPITLSIDAATGRIADTDFRGRSRIINAMPTLENYNQIYGFDPLHPNNLISDSQRRIGVGPLLGSTPPPAQAPIQVIVQTMDSKSFMDNSKHIADAVRKAFQDGHPVRHTITDKLVRPF